MEEVKNNKMKIMIPILIGVVLVLIGLFILWLIKWFVYKICVFDIIGHAAICFMIYYSSKCILVSRIVNRVITYSIGLYWLLI